ncbi:hypothetical protein [Spirosoma fluviale]|uniref:Uncharacterized protein n=1 Tax=Spirosoma fluviale TaxID=1597977 RepID=A0A286GRR7_9BACT|nr:hypothetical protein [Spirosoma fluviale]SOD97749.1 hypothetical protein SAMN06269250_5907 [Spirosoma fluviale]
MKNEPIKQKILADYTTLLGLKHDNPDLIKEKLKRIGERINHLGTTISEEKDVVGDAARLVDSALTIEFVTFMESLTEDDQEEALAQLKHKVAEACQLLQIHA